MKQIKFICAAMLIFNTVASAQAIHSFTATYSNTAPDKIAAILSVPDNHTVQLNWNIENKENVQRFEIERSMDNEHYKKVLSLSQPFSSNEERQFNCKDVIAKPTDAVYYYRLKIVNNHRDVKISPAQVVRIKNSPISNSLTVVVPENPDQRNK